MGATASIELEKPVDASDILASNSLDFAKSEVIRLRRELGHLAAAYGVEILSYDASDIVLGRSDDDDFHRCVREIAHIRACLQLNTAQAARRGRRGREYKKIVDDDDDGKESDGSDSNSEDESKC
jgi:hypothetical protein